MGADTGVVRTAFNWVADVEWAAWYLADANGDFNGHGVVAEFVHGGPNTPSVAQTLAAGDADLGVASDHHQQIKAKAEGAANFNNGARYHAAHSTSATQLNAVRTVPSDAAAGRRRPFPRSGPAATREAATSGVPRATAPPTRRAEWPRNARRPRFVRLVWLMMGSLS